MKRKIVSFALVLAVLITSSGVAAASPGGTIGSSASDVAVSETRGIDASDFGSLGPSRSATTDGLQAGTLASGIKFYCTLPKFMCTSLPGPTTFTKGRIIVEIAKAYLEEIASWILDYLIPV